MEANAQHIIRKLVVDLEWNPIQDRVSETEVQQRISQNVYQYILPCIDRCFARLAVPEGTTLRLDKIYLDLGDLSSFSDLADHLSEQIETALAEQLAAYRSVQGQHHTDRIALQYETGKLLDAFVQFLQTGRLPWWASSRPIDTWENEILGAIIHPDNEGFCATVLSTALRTPLARKRLAYQFSQNFVLDLLSISTPEYKTKLSVFQQETLRLVRLLHLTSEAEQQLKLTAWQTVCQNLFESRPLTWADPLFVRQWAEGLIAASGIGVLQKIVKKLAGSTPVEPFTNAFVHAGIEELLAQQPRRITPLKDSAPGPAGLLEESTTESVYVSNAGAVLIAPFLPAFFSHLGLLEDDLLTDVDRAACLLQFLVTSQGQFAEYDLFLNKILCGIPSEQPLIPTHKIKRSERQEARRMLRSVVEYWSALKGSSPESLQVNFLQRNGMIQPYENGWKLTVEQQTFDILLEDLPWTISYIQLPWMKKPLWVDWA